MTHDLRRYARQTNTRLFAGFLLILFLVGDGLIYIFYGREAAILGLFCLVGGLIPLIFIWLVFVLIDWVVKRANRE
jgi:TM2 domain-containing membrane protein YozV